MTRAGIKMRSIGGGTTATNSAGFASAPWWLNHSVFNGAEFELAAGSWEVAVVISGNAAGATLRMIDAPAGAANVRQAISLTGAANSLSGTDGTVYSNASTAVAGVVNNLAFVPVTISNIGSGVGGSARLRKRWRWHDRFSDCAEPGVRYDRSQQRNVEVRSSDQAARCATICENC